MCTCGVHSLISLCNKIKSRDYGEQRRYDNLENTGFSLQTTRRGNGLLNKCSPITKFVIYLTHSNVFLLGKWDQQNISIAKILFFKASDKPRNTTYQRS